MPKADDLIRTIEAIHAAGLDAARWPEALVAATDLIGGVGATFEVLDKKTKRPIEWRGYGIPTVSEVQYTDQYAALSPRAPVGFRLGAGQILYDRLVLDEAGMDRDPFYSDFLVRYGFRYFISTNILQTRDEAVPFAIQRSPRQGHAGQREIALMRRLTPHLQQAHDVARRLKRAQFASRTLEQAFDWLADGVMLVTAAGAVTYANAAMQDIARRGDGVRIVKARIEFSDSKATARYGAALGQIARLRGGAPDSSGGDFAALRAGGATPYLVSVRPLTRRGDGRHDSDAAAIVFMHDPLKQNAGAIRAFCDAFGLTDAETALAEALQSGVVLSDYARDKRLSLNTVYTHLRHLKEKTNCHRMAELIRKLNNLQTPLRIDP